MVSLLLGRGATGEETEEEAAAGRGTLHRRHVLTVGRGHWQRLHHTRCVREALHLHLRLGASHAHVVSAHREPAAARGGDHRLV